MTTTTHHKKILTLTALLLSSTVNANLVISEIASRGTSNACNGEDWVELFNSGPNDADLTGYILTDERGFQSEDAEPFNFPTGYTLAAETYLLMCGGTAVVAGVNGTASLLPFAFGIGNDDTVQLVQVESQDGELTRVVTVSVVGPLPASLNGDVRDVTFALDLATGQYNYTSTPTPGDANVMTRIPTKEELTTERKAQMIAQNDLGIDFFNFDRQGLPVATGMDPVLDLKIVMNESSQEELERNPQYELYQDFQQASLFTLDGTELLTLSSPGRIRTRGIEETYRAVCLGSPLPFRLDFDSTNDTQTMFGVQKIYLRHPILDPSHMREWAYPRMLARFGLPHARSRMVNFYINDEFQGLYALLEILEQEYVFARNFPDYDPNDFAFFQTKSLTENCGRYTQAQLETADARIDEYSTPPYAFERGEHNGRIPQLGGDKVMEECKQAYQEYHDEVLMADVVLAYLRNDEVCAQVFLAEGLLDQELGSDNWDKEIENFIEDYMSGVPCEPDCTNSDLAKDVDVENFLKMLAFYAVTLTLESPLTNTNNFYLAQQNGQDKKWKLVAFGFDKPGAAGCNEKICNLRLIHWSITRPTCESLESSSLVGPLLSNSTLLSEYLGYVQEFVETVYTSPDLIQQIQDQAAAIEDSVKSSFGSGASFDLEMTTDADWDSGSFPLLSTMIARAEDVQKQLAALDDGSYPRSAKNNVGGGEVWESCADWQVSEPDNSACEEGCKYEGCEMSGWTVQSSCDEATGTCYHGDMDQECQGVADGDTHPAMDGSFCRYAAGIPVRTTECLAVGATLVPATGSSDPNSSGNQGSLAVGGIWFATLTLCLHLLTS